MEGLGEERQVGLWVGQAARWQVMEQNITRRQPEQVWGGEGAEQARQDVIGELRCVCGECGAYRLLA